MVSRRRELRARLRRTLRSVGLVADESEGASGAWSDPSLEFVVVDLTERRGMEFPRAVTEARPDLRVLAIGYPAGPEEIEEATHLGVGRFLAADLPETELCQAVSVALDLATSQAARYEASIERAREKFRRREVHQAEAIARRAITWDPVRPEAYNLVGVAREATLNRCEALQFYRIALVLDAAYELAKRNRRDGSEASQPARTS